MTFFQLLLKTFCSLNSEAELLNSAGFQALELLWDGLFHLNLEILSDVTTGKWSLGDCRDRAQHDGIHQINIISWYCISIESMKIRYCLFGSPTEFLVQSCAKVMP